MPWRQANEVVSLRSKHQGLNRNDAVVGSGILSFVVDRDPEVGWYDTGRSGSA